MSPYLLVRSAYTFFYPFLLRFGLVADCHGKQQIGRLENSTNAGLDDEGFRVHIPASVARPLGLLALFFPSLHSLFMISVARSMPIPCYVSISVPDPYPAGSKLFILSPEISKFLVLVRAAFVFFPHLRVSS